jgi:hypothetical protein
MRQLEEAEILAGPTLSETPRTAMFYIEGEAIRCDLLSDWRALFLSNLHEHFVNQRDEI